jgi:hypothetical protein
LETLRITSIHGRLSKPIQEIDKEHQTRKLFLPSETTDFSREVGTRSDTGF